MIILLKLIKLGITIEVPDNKTPVEVELSNFSTQIKSRGSGRLHNIRLSCSKINEIVLEQGKEFSFEQVVGKVSAAQGYQEADIFIDKKIVKGYGGGNCQVSTTLYNAVLAVPGLVITERHPHGRKVDYVPEGKDAAVSYGTLDFKFKNDTGYTIKIYAGSDDTTLTIRIVKINE